MTTAKEILIKHFLSCDSEYKLEEIRIVMEDDSEEGKLIRAALAAMKEACELAYRAGAVNMNQRSHYPNDLVTAPNEKEFINSLFPEKINRTMTKLESK